MSKPTHPSRFSLYVQQGLDAGLGRAEAERRAREQLFTIDKPVPIDDGPAESAADAGWLATGVHKGVDALWSELQQAWKQRDSGGVELVDVLEEINELLERGLVTAEEFETLLQRANKPGALPKPKASKGGGARR